MTEDKLIEAIRILNKHRVGGYVMSCYFSIEDLQKDIREDFETLADMWIEFIDKEIDKIDT